MITLLLTPTHLAIRLRLLLLLPDPGGCPRPAAPTVAPWRLIAATHNLLKLHSHWIAPATE
jgi:hypothetical protein